MKKNFLRENLFKLKMTAYIKNPVPEGVDSDSFGSGTTRRVVKIDPKSEINIS